jgi:type II secretion system protein H
MSRTGDKAKVAGFTLVEILVVLAILGLLIGIAVPLYSGSQSRLRLTSAAQELMQDLRLARRLAIRDATVIRLVFDPEKAGYRIQETSKTLPVTFTLQNKSSVRADENLVRFYPDGSADPAVFVLRDGTRSKRIRLDWLKGRIMADAAP